MSEVDRRSVVIRLLERYLAEVVERHNLCPWAENARANGEVAVEVLWGTPSTDEWVETATSLLARPRAAVAMVVAPELGLDRIDMHDVRNAVAARIPTAGVAEFHPGADLDLASPPRLVPFTRRSPDPLLQLVPLATLANVRPPPPSAERIDQLRMLGNLAPPPRRDAADRIAENNHARISLHAAEIVATLDDIAADRARSYAAAGIRFAT